MKRLAATVAPAVVLAALAVWGQFRLHGLRPNAAPVLSEGVIAAIGGLRSVAAEIVWFRADRLQEEGRYVELAQLASTLTFLEPHTPEVWSYAAWNLAYNVSVMMPTPADRWRWVHAAIRLLRDEGLVRNPASSALCRELAWLFELKLGTDLDAASAVYRAEWRRIVEDVAARDAWSELRMDPAVMRRIEAATGFDDWTDPQLSAIYWAAAGRCADIVRQASALYRKNRGERPERPKR
ncbi:MAG: hypothetical protein ACI4RD_03950 [Kiritimatiellia bacterium]